MSSRATGRLFSSLLSLALILVASVSLAQTPTLIISEYIDGTGENNALEVFNGTGGALHLGDYFLRIRFKDQPGVMLTVQLQAGTFLPSGGTWLLVDDGAGAPLAGLADQTASLVDFNGDDAITLSTWNGSTYPTVDSIGQWDIDPGDYWGCTGGNTQSVTMRRKFEICSGDPIESDPFTPCPEWDFYPFDTFDDAGSHTAFCQGTVETEDAHWGTIKAMYR